MKKKSIFSLMLTLSLFLSIFMTACSSDSKETSDKATTTKQVTTTAAEETTAAATEETQAETDAPAPAADFEIPQIWQNLRSSFTRDDSSQYKNAVLDLKYLEENYVLFELNIMESSEDEEGYSDMDIAGIMTLNEEGTATYQNLTVTLEETDEGVAADITTDGDFDVLPDGHYIFTSDELEPTSKTATALVEFLPTADTTLNTEKGGYILTLWDEMLSEWFYQLEAQDKDNENLTGFLVAKDFSSVFRVEEDTDPVMIYGSAQPMMDAYVMEEQDGGEDDPSHEPRPLLEVSLPNGPDMEQGDTDTLEVLIPGDLPYTLTAESEDESIVTIDEDYNVTAVAPGETVINCTITCEDGVAEIGIVVRVE